MPPAICSISTMLCVRKISTELSVGSACHQPPYAPGHPTVPAPPVALGRTNCVDFYRAELVRQRDLSQDSWGFLLPFVPGMALALLDGVLEARSTSQLIALVAGGVGLFLGIAWWNAHTARKLQDEIDGLDAS